MDQRQIERFVDVVESGSLTRTSKRLNISQPALSKSLRLLEEQLGIRLLERGPRGVRVTKFGDVFYRRARSITAEFRRAREDLEELKGSSEGEVAVGVTPGPGVLDRILPEAISRVANKRPSLKFTVRSGTTAELLTALTQGDLDILFTVVDEHLRGPDLKAEILFEDHFVIVVGRKHPLMAAEAITLEDLTSFRWVLLQDADTLWEAIEALARQAGLTPKSPIESNSVVFVRSMVSRSDCIGILPSHAAELSAEVRDLVSIPLDRLAEHRVLPRLLRPMGLVHCSEMELTAGARAILRSITTVCRELKLIRAAA
jgi:DNA-binding transcriptional LysR family regulator